MKPAIDGEGAIGGDMLGGKPDTSPRLVIAWSSLSAVLALLTGFASLLLGPSEIGVPDVLRALVSWTGMIDAPSREVQEIVLGIRLPRVLLAASVGGGLSVAGLVFQVLLRNVLAEPYILGVSGAASVGALAALATGIGMLFPGAMQICAFISSLLVVFVVYALGCRGSVGEGEKLLLVGVMIGAFMSAVVLMLVSVSGETSRNALFWLLGFLGNARLSEIFIVMPTVVVLVSLTWSQSHAYNVLTLGREQATHLGVKVGRVNAVSYFTASLLTAVLVSAAGAIGFIGLIIPHTVRLALGPDHRMLIPVSFFLGAVFLIICDVAARTVLSPTELPVGVFTAAIGAPVFILLLSRRN
ncbi:MAG: iron ABC transporter permease [Bacteroidota bacterium]|nr:iron ABC transporter permease [Bacteroidota bacterium]